MPHPAKQFLRPGTQVDRDGLTAEQSSVVFPKNNAASGCDDSPLIGRLRKQNAQHARLDIPKTLFALCLKEACDRTSDLLADDVVGVDK